MPLILVAGYQFEVTDLRRWATHRKIHTSENEDKFAEEVAAYFHRNGSRLLVDEVPGESEPPNLPPLRFYMVCREGVDQKSSWAGWRSLKETDGFKAKKTAFFGDDEEIFEFIKNASFVTVPSPLYKD